MSLSHIVEGLKSPAKSQRKYKYKTLKNHHQNLQDYFTYTAMINVRKINFKSYPQGLQDSFNKTTVTNATYRTKFLIFFIFSENAIIT